MISLLIKVIICLFLLSIILGLLSGLVSCSTIPTDRATIDEVESVSPSNTDHPDWGTPYEMA